MESEIGKDHHLISKGHIAGCLLAVIKQFQPGCSVNLLFEGMLTFHSKL